MHYDKSLSHIKPLLYGCDFLCFPRGLLMIFKYNEYCTIPVDERLDGMSTSLAQGVNGLHQPS